MHHVIYGFSFFTVKSPELFKNIGLIKTGDRLTVPARLGMDRDLDGRDIAGSLWELGFRGSTDPDDLGLTFALLLAVLGAFFTVFILVSWFFTARSRDGN